MAKIIDLSEKQNDEVLGPCFYRGNFVYCARLSKNIAKMESLNNTPILFYTAPDGTTQLDVKLENETVWLNVEQMSVLFGRDRTVISRHIRNCFAEEELVRETTCAKFAHMGNDGLQAYETVYYNLDVIISVGYRVKSVNGTRFRQWANRVLKV